MPVTAKQLERRKAHLGSSDMAAVMDVNPYSTKYDVWAMKTGRLPDTEETPVMQVGTILEPAILGWFQGIVGPLTQNQYRSMKSTGVPIGANIDALVVKTGAPVEAKTVGLFGYSKELWGEADTDQVPDRVLVQCTVHMMVTDQDVCWVPVLIAGRGLLQFVVRRDEQVVDAIKDAAVEFWEKHVLTDVPPDSMPSANVIAKMRRQPNSVVPINADLVRAWDEAKKIEKAAKEEAKTAQLELLAALGDAEAGTCDIGDVTYFEQTRKEHLVKESTFRVIRFKSNSKEKN